MTVMYRYGSSYFWRDQEMIVSLYVSKYPIVRKTPKGCWVDDYGKERFVLEGEGKRFAYYTKEKALYNFLRRKQTQIKILNTQLLHATQALVLAKKGIVL